MNEIEPTALTPSPEYQTYHRYVIEAIRVALYRRWPPQADTERAQLERNVSFFDVQCSYEQEMAEGMDPAEVADDEIDATT